MKKFFVMILFTGICACSYGQSTYFPLEKGTTLTYAYGSELYGGSYDDMRLKVSFLSSTKIINGIEYVVTETSSGKKGEFTKVMTTYARYGNDNSILTKLEEDAEEYIAFKASPKIGDTWDSQNGKTSTSNRVISLSGEIKTDKTTYTDCLVLAQKDDNGTTMKSYYQKNVGMVATTILQEDSEKIFIYLISE